LWLYVVHVDGVEVGLLLIAALGRLDVVLEAGAKVHHADDSIGNGKDDEQDRDHGEGSQGLADCGVLLLGLGLVDSNELEEEPRQAAEVEDDGADHAGLVLVAGEVGGRQQDDDSDGNSGDCQVELDVGLSGDYDQKLDGKAQEEEEIELQESNVDLGLLAGGLSTSRSGDHLPGSGGISFSFDNQHQCA
jgi:hypothetical protein